MLIKGLEVTCVNGLGDDGALCRLPRDIADPLGHQVSYYMYCQEIRLIPEETVYITLSCLAPFEENKVEIYYGDYLMAHEVSFDDAATLEIKPLEEIAEEKLIYTFRKGCVYDPRLVRIVLLSKRIRIDSVKGRFSLPDESHVPDQNMLVYGTSISQGTATHIASGSYPYLLARKMGMNADNYSFAGQCLLEESVVDFLCSFNKRYDLIIFEPSTNLLAQGYTIKQFADKVKYALNGFMKAYPEARICCIDLFESVFDHGVSGIFRLNAEPDEYRKCLADVCKEMNNDQIVLVHARDLVSTSNLSADLLHPSTYGYFEIAENLYKILSLSAERS